MLGRGHGCRQESHRWRWGPAEVPLFPGPQPPPRPGCILVFDLHVCYVCPWSSSKVRNLSSSSHTCQTHQEDPMISCQNGGVAGSPQKVQAITWPV